MELRDGFLTLGDRSGGRLLIHYEESGFYVKLGEKQDDIFEGNVTGIEHTDIEWSEYCRYRTAVRGFHPAKIEAILRFSGERYRDTVTGRMVAVGRHDDLLVIVPYERQRNIIIPITIHATTRQQINFRLKTGRFTYE